MKRLLSSLLALLLGIYPASAAVVTIGVKDAAGTTRTFNVTTTTDITGALSGNVVLCDQSTGSTCASVGTAGSPSTNALTIQAVTLGHGTAANAMRVELPTDGTGQVNAQQAGTWTVQPGNTANTTPWLFIGNQANNADAVATGTNSVPTLAYNYGFNGTTWDRLRVDGSKNLNVNCAVGCSAASNIAQIAGVTLGATAVVNYGTTPAAVAVPAVNAFVTNAAAPGQATMSASSPVVIASDQTAVAVKGSDPCLGALKSTASFSSTTSGGSIITAASSKKTYLCSLSVVSSTASNVSIIEGTGASICTGGSPAAVWGNTGTTAANGFAFAANGGIATGDGNGTIASSATNNQNICLLFTTTNTPLVVATATYVQQ